MVLMPVMVILHGHGPGHGHGLGNLPSALGHWPLAVGPRPLAPGALGMCMWLLVFAFVFSWLSLVVHAFKYYFFLVPIFGLLISPYYFFWSLSKFKIDCLSLLFGNKNLDLIYQLLFIRTLKQKSSEILQIFQTNVLKDPSALGFELITSRI